MAYVFVIAFIVLPLLVLAFSVSRTLRDARRGEVKPSSEPVSRWGDRVGPSLREHQLLAEGKQRVSAFEEPVEARLVRGQRPALGAVPARRPGATQRPMVGGLSHRHRSAA